MKPITLIAFSSFSLLGPALTLAQQGPSQPHMRTPHHYRNSQKSTGTLVRMIANYDGVGTAGGTYRNNDSSFYVYSGNRTGFDLTGNIPMVSSNGLILDSDADTLTNWRWDLASSSYKVNFRILNIYGVQNGLVNSFFQFPSAGVWVSSSRSTTYYDAAGNDSLTASDTWNSTTSSWDPSYRDMHTYDASGNELTGIYQDWNAATSTWKNTDRDIFTYDANGNMLTTLAQKWSNSINNWRNYSNATYTYNAANLRQSVASQLYDTLASIWNNDYRALDYYNGANQHTAAVTQNGSGSSWINSDSQSYAPLNAAGLPLTSYDCSWTAGSWQLRSRSTTTYSAANLPIAGMLENWNGSSYTNSRRYTYFYNTYNKPTNIYTEDWNGSAWAITANNDNKRYYYEAISTGVAGGALATPVQAYLYPVPASDNVQLAAHWTHAQACTGAVYDACGRKLMDWTDNAGEFYTKSIAIGALPAGVYYLRLQGQRENWSGSFIVQH